MDGPIEMPISKKPLKQDRRNSANQRHWDPRFDKRTGGFDPEIFSKNYRFVDDIRKDEQERLKKALKKTKNVEKKEEIKSAIVKIQNKFVAKKDAEKRREVVKELSSKKKFVKKSDVKKELLARKYEELKQSGKLKRYMERKRKKLIKKDIRGFEAL